MTDPRDLIRRLADALENSMGAEHILGGPKKDLAAEARAYLAQPVREMTREQAEALLAAEGDYYKDSVRAVIEAHRMGPHQVFVDARPVPRAQPAV